MKMPTLLTVLLPMLLTGCHTMAPTTKVQDTESTRLAREWTMARKAAHTVVAVPNEQTARTAFTEPADLNSIFLIKCPVCHCTQFLTPLVITGTGASRIEPAPTPQNDNTAPSYLQQRSLQFICGERRCKAIITITDQIVVPPVKAIRVR